MRRPVKVSITYCVECGYQHEAFNLAEALLNKFDLMLSGVELIPWANGSFDVKVNGDLVHSMYRDGGFPEPEAMFQAVDARLEAPA
jgi:selenoprotein W-related protein